MNFETSTAKRSPMSFEALVAPDAPIVLTDVQGRHHVVRDPLERARMGAIIEEQHIKRLEDMLAARRAALSVLRGKIRDASYTPQQRAVITQFRRANNLTECTVEEWCSEHADFCCEHGFTPVQAADWLWAEGVE